jgi:hypothetical protein
MVDESSGEPPTRRLAATELVMDDMDDVRAGGPAGDMMVALAPEILAPPAHVEAHTEHR